MGAVINAISGGAKQDCEAGSYTQLAAIDGNKRGGHKENDGE